jgi:hypothetical protein
LDTKSLQSLLNVEQALADAAHFIISMQSKGYTGKWVVFGCSYSGALSSWVTHSYTKKIYHCFVCAFFIKKKKN